MMELQIFKEKEKKDLDSKPLRYRLLGYSAIHVSATININVGWIYVGKLVERVGKDSTYCCEPFTSPQERNQ